VIKWHESYLKIYLGGGMVKTNQRIQAWCEHMNTLTYEQAQKQLDSQSRWFVILVILSLLCTVATIALFKHHGLNAIPMTIVCLALYGFSALMYRNAKEWRNRLINYNSVPEQPITEE